MAKGNQGLKKKARVELGWEDASDQLSLWELAAVNGGTKVIPEKPNSINCDFVNEPLKCCRLYPSLC